MMQDSTINQKQEQNVVKSENKLEGENDEYIDFFMGLSGGIMLAAISIGKNIGLVQKDDPQDESYNYDEQANLYFKDIEYNEGLLRLLGASSYSNINITLLLIVGLVASLVIIASGITDLVSDGEKVYKIFNGTAKLKKITGTGCMSSSLIASFLPCTDKPIEAAFMGTLSMSLSGELADITKPAVGTFKTYLFDNIDTLDVETFEKYAKVEL